MQKGEDGIVTIDKEECIGCKACMLACPYDALSYRENEDGYFGSVLNEYEALVYQGMPVEKVDKCDFCKGNGRLGSGEKPACVQACMAGARIFDDLDNLQGIIAQGGGYQLLPEEGTNPSVYYLPNRYY
jgi:molybdopterin-containing oxidoreductase family iron-sulfur binding subunit